MKKLIFLLCLSILLFLTINFASAENLTIQISIVNATISVGGFIEANLGGLLGTQKLPGIFLPTFNESISSNPIVCSNVIVGNETYQQNCSLNIKYGKEIPLNFNSTQTVYSTSSDTEQKYNACVMEKANFIAAYTACSAQQADYKGIETNYTSCTSSLSICNSERSSLQATNTALTTEQEQNKNKPIIYGLVGVAIGIAGAGFYFGKWGGPKMKKPEDEYNQRQSA